MFSILLICLLSHVSHGAAWCQEADYVNLDESERWLKAHNYVRCLHGQPELVWSSTVETNCMDHPYQCPAALEHSESYNNDPSSGENLAAGYSNPESVVKAWYDEIENYGTGINGANTGVVGHYTALIWESTTELGCFMRNDCNNQYGTWQVCQYANSAPNTGQYEANVPQPVNGQMPFVSDDHKEDCCRQVYRDGPTCSLCDSDQTYNGCSVACSCSLNCDVGVDSNGNGCDDYCCVEFTCADGEIKVDSNGDGCLDFCQPPGCSDAQLANGATWNDVDGSTYNCQWYANRSCPNYGNAYANNGFLGGVEQLLNAQQACCACGGGDPECGVLNCASDSSAADTDGNGCNDECACLNNLNCANNEVEVDTNLNNCVDTCQPICGTFNCADDQTAVDNSGDGCDDTCDCKPLVCALGYAGVDTDSNNCADTCELTCVVCASDEIGVDTDNNGCDDTCECQTFTCGNGLIPVDTDGNSCNNACIEPCMTITCPGDQVATDTDNDGCADDTCLCNDLLNNDWLNCPSDYIGSDTDDNGCTDTCVCNAPVDCANTCGGPAQLDCSGTCNGSATNDPNGMCCDVNEKDCLGVCAGLAQQDCKGDCNGTAVIDCAGTCDGNAVEDCEGTCNGNAVEDCEGTCGGNASCAPECQSECEWRDGAWNQFCTLLESGQWASWYRDYMCDNPAHADENGIMAYQACSACGFCERVVDFCPDPSSNCAPFENPFGIEMSPWLPINDSFTYQDVCTSGQNYSVTLTCIAAGHYSYSYMISGC